MSRKLFRLHGRWAAAGALAAVAVFSVVFVAGSAFGGPSPSSFQLDGDAMTQAAPGDDWDKVFNHTASDFSSVFIPYSVEKPSADGTAWTPGTKATDDISSWSWQSNTSVINAKADITDAFAAAYTSGTRTLMYFGLDRFDESGDANVGFWFLQDPSFKLNADGSFSGHHQEGDVFIQSQFLNGGGIALPVEYTWHNGALVQQQTGAICTSVEQPLCAIDNDGTGGRPGVITVPWDYQDKDGNPVGTIEPNGLFEGGFDIGSLFQGGDLPCFTHFIAQTGTSGASGNSETLKDIAAGDVQSCGTIQLKKHWVGAPDSATLKIGKTDGAGDLTSKTVTTDGSTDEVEAKAATYYVSETIANAGAFTSSLACFKDVNHDGTQQAGEPAVTATATAQGASVNLGIGDHIVCTYTNTRKPHLTLQKVVTNDNGGSATAAQWTLSASAANDPNNFSGAGPTQQHDVTPGVAYALAESNGPSGYTPSAWSCDGGTQNGASITLAAGQNVTCTITNDDNPPALHLRKTVTNDNGGTAAATAWTLTATKSGAQSPALSGSTPVDSGASFQAGTYSLAESGPSGYSATAWSCTGGQQPGSTVTVGVGQDVTCTINNNDVQPKLIVIKHVINDDGGSAVAGDFTMQVTGGSPNPASSAGAESPGTQVALNAGSYSVTETGPAGYASSFSADCSGSIGVGETKTCTVTNDDSPSKLVVIKHVINDNGGTAVAGDFTMNVSGNAPSKTGFAGAESPGTDVSIGPGEYSVSETGLAGYASSLSADCHGTIALGETKTCTITNDDRAPVLHLRKTVVNDNGGTAAAAAWTLSASGPSSLSGHSPVDSGSDFKAGSYTLAETDGPAGYTAGQWVCTGGSQDGTTITVGLGESATCTITNDDNAPQLHLRKVVVNDDGGTATADAWTLSATGPTNLSGHSPVDSGSGFKAGEYALAESGPSGYTASDWSCVAPSGESTTTVAVAGSKVQVGLGQNVTCTITNDDTAPTVTVNKVVVPSTDQGTFDFTLTQGANKTVFDNKGAGFANGQSTGAVEVSAGDLTVAESGHGSTDGSQYTSQWSCSSGNGRSGNGTGTSISLAGVALGENVTCTFTNTKVTPPPPPPASPAPAPKVDIQITKSAAPNPVTVGKQVTWSMVVTNNGPSNATGVTVADPVPAGMTFVSVTSSQGTCTGGALVSCQLGNLNVGSSVTITLVTTASTTGTITNTATTVANEQETNTANNSASASVLVNGPFVPPVTYCTAVAVSPKQLLVGRNNTLNLKVSQHGKAKSDVKVRVKGSTIRLTTKPSNGKGLIKQTVKPMKAGIVVFTPVTAKSCKNPRVGVIGVFTPPVTG